MVKMLPIGIQSFEDIIKSNCVYADKTKEIYNLLKTGKVYFLSRPRRFGKSVLCLTLEALFLGKKELFKGLWIEKSDYDWKQYPDTVKIKSEKYYQIVLFLVMRLVGLEVFAEVPTDFGRIDLTFQTKKHIYLIECKHRGTPDSAIKQIIENEYDVPFKKSKKKIVYVGIAFGLPKKALKSKKRKIEVRWRVKLP